jgi:hypothetical protein
MSLRFARSLDKPLQIVPHRTTEDQRNGQCGKATTKPKGRAGDR